MQIFLICLLNIAILGCGNRIPAYSLEISNSVPKILHQEIIAAGRVWNHKLGFNVFNERGKGTPVSIHWVTDPARFRKDFHAWTNPVTQEIFITERCYHDLSTNEILFCPKKDTGALDSILQPVIRHELGHMLGLSHFTGSSLSLMATESSNRSYWPTRYDVINVYRIYGLSFVPDALIVPDDFIK